MSPTTSALVAHYDSTPGSASGSALWRLAEGVQGHVAAALGDDFVARDPATVHSTVLGLDDTPVSLHGPLGARARALLAEQPLRLQAGGWPDTDLPVSSRGRRLHERTLSRFGSTLVLLAWPVEDDGAPSTRLDTLRRELVAAGGRHRYPLDSEHQDPDAHLVIGTLHPDADPAEVDRRLVDARGALAAAAYHLVVGPDDLSVVTYDDPSLPRASTRVSRPWLTRVLD